MHSVQAAPVRVGTAQLQRVPVEITSFGSAESLSSIDLKAQVSGEIVDVLFQEGDRVHAGQTLFQIDPRPFQVALEQAQANLARYEAQLSLAKANLHENEVRAENAQLELERNKTLLAREIVTQEEFDQSRTSAEAMLAASRANTAAVRAAEQDIRAAQSDVDSAQLNLSYCTVQSPIDGRTGNLMFHKGDLVSMAAGTPLVVIMQTKPIYVSFTLPERFLPQLRAAQESGGITVHAKVPESDMPPVTGQISFVDNTVDRDTSTIRLKATFENADEELWPGQYVEVAVQLRVIDNAVVVPARAVQTSQRGPYVYLVDNTLNATMRPVTLGPAMQDIVVIESGLQAGDRIVVEGHLRVTPDGPVKILDEPKPVEAATS